MARTEQAIRDHLNAASDWLKQQTGMAASSLELESHFQRRLAELRGRHITDRFESYSIEECIIALKLSKSLDKCGSVPPCDVSVPSKGVDVYQPKRGRPKNPL